MYETLKSFMTNPETHAMRRDSGEMFVVLFVELTVLFLAISYLVALRQIRDARAGTVLEQNGVRHCERKVLLQQGCRKTAFEVAESLAGNQAAVPVDAAVHGYCHANWCVGSRLCPY